MLAHFSPKSPLFRPPAQPARRELASILVAWQISSASSTSSLIVLSVVYRIVYDIVYAHPRQPLSSNNAFSSLPLPVDDHMQE